MEVIVGKEGGFCFGVKRALEGVELLAKERKNVHVLGEIIHNEIVNEKLKKLGVKQVESVEEVDSGIIVIRTHGETPETYEKAKAKGLEIYDYTCPFVKAIQKRVEEYEAKGYEIIILGDKTHPEVIGINGWCKNKADIYLEGKEIPLEKYQKAILVEQTTYSTENFSKFLESISKKGVKKVEIFSTICYTTKSRQHEAKIISKKADAVIVLGGKNSNNTNKLYNLCKSVNANTYRLYSPKEIRGIEIENFKKVGIVLGASTPNEQFQEVISIMGENTEVKVNEVEVKEEAVNETKEVLEASVEQVEQVEVKEPENIVEGESTPVETETKKTKKKSEKKPMSAMEAEMAKLEKRVSFRPNQVINATVVAVKDDGLMVSVNGKSEVLLKKEDMLNEYVKEDYESKIDSKMRLMVKSVSPLVLSEKMMARIYEEDKKIEAIKNGEIFEVEIKEQNKGGLTAKYESYEVFIPLAQIRRGFVKPEELEKFIGKKMQLKAIEVKRGKKREIIASRRVILEEEYKIKEEARKQKEEAFFSSVQQNDIVDGTVVRFAPFGAIVEVEGFDCLAHISDLSWYGCKDCSEVLEVGKTYEFVVLKLDEEKKHASLGYKQLQPKPFDIYVESHQIGDVVKGKVAKIVPYGAFIELDRGVDGLVHLSQISNQWLENPVSALKVGDEHDFKIIDINVDKFKITLSIKALLEEKKEEEAKVVKSKKAEETEVELREWKDDAVNEFTLGDLFNTKNED